MEETLFSVCEHISPRPRSTVDERFFNIVTMLPESPRWLIKTGNVAQGRKVLAALLDDEEDSAHLLEHLACCS
jgi:hypothetical protein